LKVAPLKLEQYLETSNLEPIRKPHCPYCHANHRNKMIAHHGSECTARIRKIGKDIVRFTLKGTVTNYIY
jgi:hypothetical protein